MTYIPEFSEPNPIGRGLIPRSPSANQGRGERGESCPSGKHLDLAATGKVPIPGSEIPPYIYDSDKPGTKTVIPRFETAPHGVESPTPPADR